MRRAGALLLALALAALTLAPLALADFGDFDSGDFDAGGGDYGGSDSYDSGHYRDDGASGSPDRVALGVGVALCLFMVGLPALSLKKRTGGPGKRVAPAEALSRQDPDFRWEDVEPWIRDLYARMQDAWGKADIKPLYREFTPECWERFDRQLAQKTAAGRRGHVRNIRFNNITPRGFRDAGTDMLFEVVLETTITSWNTDRSGSVVSGDPDNSKRMRYIWTLSRPADRRTPDPAFRACPRCGASASYLAGACPACGAWLERDDQDWRLADIRGGRAD